MLDVEIEKGLVSTIIPVYNRPRMLVECLRSVLEQDYRPIEIIVVDDGSTDSTPDALQQMVNQHPEIISVRIDNSGPGVAREAARMLAKGEYIQYLDSDDLLLPTKFSTQVAALIEHPECAAAYGKTDAIVRDQPLTGIAMRETGVKHSAMFPLFFRSRWWGTSTPLYRREVTDKVGPWLATSTEEDWEYDCRVAARGGQLAYVDQFVSVARRHAGQISTGGTVDPEKLRDRCVTRSSIYLHAKRYQKLKGRISQIEEADWQYFSKYCFLLARECAAAGLVEQAEDMIKLSIKSNGNRRTYKHFVFSMVGRFLGWPSAARLVAFLGK